MSRGGYRQGAGRKAGWKHGETQTIRIPVALRDELLTIARQLDNRESIQVRTDSELKTLIDKWQAKCDAETASSHEWQQVRQLINEIQEMISLEMLTTGKSDRIEAEGGGIFPTPERAYRHRHGRDRLHQFEREGQYPD